MNEALGVGTLFESSGNPPPAGIVCGMLTMPDRTEHGPIRLRFAIYGSRLARTRGTIVLLQGRNEAIEKYFETIEDLAALGYMVATFDWRGQGGSGRLLSDASQGHVASFKDYVRDLEAILLEVVLPDCPGPFAILAHSMGAAVALLASPHLTGRIDRIVASAPLVALPDGGPGINTLYYASSALRLLGCGAMPVRGKPAKDAATLEGNALTGDRRRFERNAELAARAPELFLGSPTVAWLAAATGAIRKLGDSDVISTLRVPTLIVTAGADTVVSSAAAERLAWRMRSGHALGLPGARHELLQEADRHRAPFLAAADAFIGGALI